MQKGDRIATTGRPSYRQLTREVMALSSVHSVLISVLGMFFVVLVVNLVAIGYLNHYTTNRGYWLVRRKWDILQGLDAPVEWLILGDSSGNQGLVPERLREKLGGTAINVCTVGNLTLLEDVWMLETYIGRLGPPQNVLIVHAYDVWPREIGLAFVAKIPFPWRFFSSLPASVGLKERAEILLLRYVPLYSENVTLSKTILAGVRSPGSLFKDCFRLQSSGYMKSSKSLPEWVEYDAWVHIKFITENDFVLSDVNRSAMDRLIALADRYGINVYVANGPLYKGLCESEQFGRYFAQVRKELERFADSSEHIHYLPTVATFPADQMQEADHVIYPAAEIYTDQVVQEIMQVGGGR